MTASHPHGQVKMYVSQETLQSQRQCGFSPDSYTLKGALQILLSQISFPLNQAQSHTWNLFIFGKQTLCLLCRICSCCKSDACSGVFSSETSIISTFAYRDKRFYIHLPHLYKTFSFIFPTHNIVYCIMFLPLLSYA